ncbi:AP-1 complex subunit sigma-2 [Bienertia sinuspersici]
MIQFVVLINRQGKVRLTKWYSPYAQKERTKVLRELSGLVLARGPKLCNFVDWRGLKVVYRRQSLSLWRVGKVYILAVYYHTLLILAVYDLVLVVDVDEILEETRKQREERLKKKRYASLYFCMCIDQDDNELEVLEIIHHYVEILDRYFGSVCELDLIFNFHKAFYILDEILIAGELQESSKKTVARLIAAQDSLVEQAKEQESSISNIIAQATK